MAQAIAYGSITIVDITDIGEFSIQPMSNLPLSVIYDPDQDNYTPNWGTSNITITPAIYYAGEALSLGSTGLTITWQVQNGTAGAVNITDSTGAVLPAYTAKGFSSTNGALTIAQNQFEVSSTMITYIATATYVEPTSQQVLTAQGQITFTLVKNASTAETCYIAGDSIFKYNTSGNIIGASSITLTSKVSNVTISQWQYQNGSGNWVKYPGSGTGTTLTVNANDATFVNDKCLIKLATSDNEVYDLHTITKLRDGAAGTSTISAVLTNDDQMIPYIGSSPSTGFSTTSQIIIYEGGTDVTARYSIDAAGDGNVTFTKSRTNTSLASTSYDTVTVTEISADTANVTFTATKSGSDPITKTFSLVKVTQGIDGKTPTIYSVEASSYALNKTSGTNVSFNPASVTFSAYSQGENPKAAYAGRFQIFENITLSEYQAASPKPTAAYTSTVDETSHTYTPSTSTTSILCLLYKAGALTDRLDSQLVVVTTDGAKGEQGDQGEDGKGAINIVLGNYADVLTCTNSNTLAQAQVIKIPFAAYEGTTKIPCTFTSVNLLNIAPNAIGTEANSSKYATATSDGQIVWTLPSGTAVNNPSGLLSITFNATTSDGSKTIIATYSWSRNQAAKDGVNSVILQIFTPDGTNIVSPGVTSVKLQGQLTDGSVDVTTQSGVTYQWAKYQNGSYTNLSGKITYILTVQATDVDSYASYRLTANYNSNTYIAYFSVFDKTDPIQVSVMSSVGTQLVNGMGAGAIYAKVSRNNEEIDVMKSERFFYENPSSAKSGDYYYKVDDENKTITLMKYTSSWSAAPASDSTFTGQYSWTWRDKDGNTVTEMNGITLPTSGKIIYIDGSMINKKIIADVEVII